MFRRVTITLLALLLPLAAIAGELRVDTIESSALDASAFAGDERPLRVGVLLPDGYADSDRRYPAIYLLHGYGGDYAEWQRAGVEEALSGIEAIIVMPEGDRSFYANHHDNEKARWDDYVSGDVVRHVDASYRTIAARRGRAISGLSMGGFGGMVLGLAHPELFGSAASHSGALGILSRPLDGSIGERIGKIFGPEGSETRKAYDPIALLDALPKEKRPHVYFDCGSSDFLLEHSRDFAAALAKRGFDYEYREVPGGHDFPYWKRNVRYSVSRQLEALAAMPEEAPETAPSTGAIAGKWNAESETPNGEIFRSTVTIRTVDEKLAGSASWNDGAESRDLSRVIFRKSTVEMELDIERDGQKGVIRIDAKLDGDKLNGRWSVLDADGAEVLAGAWKAEREASPESAFAGNWDIEIAYSEDQVFDYVLRVERKDGKLGAALVSPRSGEHVMKSASVEDGTLLLAIEREIGGSRAQFTYRGKLDASGAISGSVQVDADGGLAFEATFKGKRKD